MKKSCSVKESKVVTSKDVDGGLNEENLTEVYLNKKLSESGTESDGLGWLERKNIFKIINVSLNSTRSDKGQRSSPRFAKTSSSRAGKWVENSFKNQKTEDTNRNCDNEKTSKTRSVKADTEFGSPSSKKTKPLKANEDYADTDLKPKNLRDVHQNGEINGSSPKSSKKIHYIKIQQEGNSKEVCRTSSEGCRKEESQGLCPGKKRTSAPEAGDVDAAKKLKMEGEGVKEEVPLKEEAPLRMEAEMEKRRRGVPFKMRDIRTIVSEQELRNKRWKETFSKYKWPARWGVPVVRSCSEKWDGKRIPSKLLHRYQKYLSSNNLFHPVFLPEKSLPSASDSNRLSEMSSQSSAGTNSECRDESGTDFRDASEGPFVEGEPKKSAAENNLSPSSSSESSERMVLRNRSQQKPVILDEDGYSSDDSDEWLSKQKPLKKQKANSKSKKSVNQNKQLVLKLERCNINKKNGGEDGRKNGNEILCGSPLLGSNPLNQSESSPKLGLDPDTMVCPICSLRFKKQLIESHATECASKTYKD